MQSKSRSHLTVNVDMVGHELKEEKLEQLGVLWHRFYNRSGSRDLSELKSDALNILHSEN